VSRVGLVFAAAGARSTVTGLTGVLLGLYLARLDLPPETVGLVLGLGLTGNACGTALLAARGDRMGTRPVLVAASLLSAAGLGVMAATGHPALLGGAALLGMVNSMGRDRGVAQAVDQTLLADWGGDAARTRLFTRYTIVQDLLGALGSLAAAAPAALIAALALTPLAADRWVLRAAGAVSLVAAALYLRVPTGRSRQQAPVSLAPASRRRLKGLAALFALDSLGGGLIAGSVLSYWFFRRFGLDGGALGPVFFAARMLNALSYVAAEHLARRIGLVRTMVFTHLPSSLLLLALPFMPTPGGAIALFLLREALVQMDVPARQSYVAAVTLPGERAYAFGVTGVVRNVGWAFGPPLAGLAIGTYGLGAPLVIGAGLKALYDLALFAGYRTVTPPEERGP